MDRARAMRQTLDGRTVVITGASSGIGRAAAHAFSHKHARLVLAARGGDELDAVVRECTQRGGVASAVPTDTGDPQAVATLVEQARVAGGGRIDIWVNNAGIAVFGRFLEVPVDAHEQVIRTNLLGYLYAAHAVLPIFRAQGGGVLINVVSMAAFAATPLASSYSASKAGNRGLFEALRTEFAGLDPSVHICDLYPAFVDTPMLEHTANYEGKRITPVPPVIAVERVARKIVSIARRPRAVTSLGAAFPVATGLHAILPAVFRWSVGRAARTYLDLAPAAGKTEAGLRGNTPGSYRTEGGLRSPATRVAAVVGAVAIFGTVVIRRWRR